MHKNFGEWYRLVSIVPTDDILQKRWAGVEKWRASIQDNDEALFETVRIFHGLPQKSSREDFLAAFREHDAAFPQRDNELEQRVLAGATLVQCVVIERNRDQNEDNNEDGVRAAFLAATAVEASRLRVSDDTLRELTAEMLAGLQEIAMHQRKRTVLSGGVLSETETEGLAKTLELVSNAPDHAQLRTHVGTAFRALLKAVNNSEHALERAEHNLRCADEETNILWWLTGCSSRDLNKPWSTLKDAVPLVAGWELADLTDVALGPQNAAALLGRVVSETQGKNKDHSLNVYVNAVPEDWAKACVAKMDEQLADLAPLSLALLHRCKSGTSAWVPFFESNCGLKASTKLTPERAAQLAYVEAVLFSTITKTER